MMSAYDGTYHSASYAPCFDCEEGALVWDEEAGASRCTACSVGPEA
ncbi:MAG: hypothetical protein ABEJ23_09265 [Haloarculaceae archaeon]